MTSTAPSLDEFLAEAEAFLAARWPRKADQVDGPAAFVWGEGSDRRLQVAVDVQTVAAFGT